MLSAFAVRRWQFTLVVFVALIALGVQSLVSIPKSEDPTFPIPIFYIVAILPGSAPTDLERLVVDPVETKLKALDDVKRLETDIDDSVAVVQIEFRAGVDADRKRDEVLREVASLRPTLPSELARLEVKQFHAGKVNVVEAALVSTAPYADLEPIARALRRQLEGTAGVGEVEIAGLPKQEIAIVLDLERMVALRVSPTEVLSAVGAESTNIPAGSVETGARKFNVKTSGDYTSIDEIKSTIVRSINDSTIRVADVAEVRVKDVEASPFARFDGERAVLIGATQREGGDVFEATKAINAELTAFAKTLPPHVRLVRGFDQSRNVAHRLRGFTRDFGIAILLVLLTLLPLGVRASIVVMVSIPLSLSIGLFVLKLAGFSINQLSIAGFVLTLGLLVDDSVVVVENIARHLRKGQSPHEAAVNATKQITVSVLGCTATLIFAFIPLLSLPGLPGQFIRSMPVAVISTIGASLLVSLTIVPFLSSRLLKKEDEHGNFFYRVLTRAIEASYSPVIERALKRPRTTMILAGALLLASFGLVPFIGFSVFPKAGIPQFIVKIDAAEGASLIETDRAARFVEGVLARHREVSRVATIVGRGHPMIYYNIAPRSERANVADVFAELASHDAREIASQLATIREELRNYAGARIELLEFENGPPQEAPIAMRLLGSDSDQLEAAAAQIERVLRETPGTRDVRNPTRDRRTDLRVKVDNDKAAVLGVAIPDIDKAVRLALGGISAGKYRAPGSEEAYDIRVTLQRTEAAVVAKGTHAQDAPDLLSLERLYTASTRGAPVPLGQVAEIVLDPSPSKIRHYNRDRSVTVTAHVRERFNTDRLTKDVLAKLATKELKGVRLTAAGELEARQESFGGLGLAILVAIFGVLAVLVLEFRTFKSTLIVASVMPLGVIGGLVALFLSGYTLSFTANIGFVALMGIEVKNSILLVDLTNQLREEGVPLDDAIRRAGQTRFVPILFTTLTAIGGLIPLILERSNLYSPLAVVVLGGLISSTFLARIVDTVLYKLVAPPIEKKKKPKDAEASEPELEPPGHEYDDHTVGMVSAPVLPAAVARARAGYPSSQYPAAASQHLAAASGHFSPSTSQINVPPPSSTMSRQYIAPAASGHTAAFRPSELPAPPSARSGPPTPRTGSSFPIARPVSSAFPAAAPASSQFPAATPHPPPHAHAHPAGHPRPAGPWSSSRQPAAAAAPSGQHPMTPTLSSRLPAAAPVPPPPPMTPTLSSRQPVAAPVSSQHPAAAPPASSRHPFPNSSAPPIPAAHAAYLPPPAPPSSSSSSLPGLQWHPDGDAGGAGEEEDDDHPSQSGATIALPSPPVKLLPDGTVVSAEPPVPPEPEPPVPRPRPPVIRKRTP